MHVLICRVLCICAFLLSLFSMSVSPLNALIKKLLYCAYTIKGIKHTYYTPLVKPAYPQRVCVFPVHNTTKGNINFNKIHKRNGSAASSQRNTKKKNSIKLLCILPLLPQFILAFTLYALRVRCPVF